jgi:hypothetical protein
MESARVVAVSKSKMHIIKLSLFAFALAVMVLLSTQIKKQLLEASKIIQRTLISRIEDSYGIQITYGSLGPSIFATIDIKDISVHAQDDGHLILQVDRLRLGYSIWQVLQGDFIGSFRSLRAERPIVSIDMVKDQALIQKFTGSSDASEHGGSDFSDMFAKISFTRGIQFHLLKGDLSLTAGTSRFMAHRFNLNGTALKDEFNLKSKLDMVLELPDVFPGPLSSSLEMRGTIGLSTFSGSLKTSLSQVKTSVFSVKKLGVQMAFTKEKLDVYKIRDFLPYTFGLSYVYEDRHVQGNIEFADFSPQTLLEPEGSLQGLSPWLGIRGSGSVSFDYYLGKDIQYKAALRATIPVPWEHTTAELTLTGIGATLQISGLSLTSSRGTVQYTGSLDLLSRSINGNATLIRVLSPTNVPIDGTFTITTRGTDYYLFGESLSLGDFIFSAIDAHINIGKETYTWDLSALHFINEESYENVRVSRIFSDGVFDPAGNLVQGTLKIDGLDLSSFYRIARTFTGGLPEIPDHNLEPWTVTSELFISSDGKHISYSSPRLIMSDQNNNSVTLIASIAGTERQFSIQDGQLVTQHAKASFNAQADFSDPQNITVRTNLVYEDVAYALDLAILDFTNITLQGSYGLSLSMLQSQDGYWSGYCKADMLPIPVENQRVLLSFDTGFRFLNTSTWVVDLHHLDLRDIPSFTRLPVSLSCAGNANPQGIQLSEIAYEDGGGALKGKLNASWGQDFSNFAISSRLADSLNSERYELDLSFSSSGETEGRLYMSRANLDRFYPTGYTPIVTGELWFNWNSMEQFAIDWKIASLQLRLFDQDALVVSSGNATPDRLELLKSSITLGNLQADIETLELSRANNAMNIASRFRGVLSSSPIDLYTALQVQFDQLPPYEALFQQLNTLHFQGALSLLKGNVDTWTIAEPITFSFGKTAQGFSLKGGPQNSIRAELSSDGAFYTAFSQPLPVRGAITGSILKGMIDANANNVYIDVSALWKLLPQKLPLQITNGFGIANLSIRGPLGDPSFFGSATASSVRMVVPDWLQDELGPVDLSILFNENTIQLAKVLIPAGKGKVLAEGSMNIERWLPGDFSFTASIPEQAAVLYKSSLLGLTANGKGWGDLSLVFQDGAFSLQGSLVISETLITYSGAPKYDNAANSQSINFKTAIDLQTGKKVEFIWPNTNFPVLRAYTDVGSVMRITSNAETGKFSVNGAISLRGGEVFYFQRSFYIRSGQLAFNENEIRFDPRIALRAELRDRTSSGPVTIALIIDNAPLSNFTPRFISEPPLSQIDIFALLGQNVIGSSEGPAGNNLQEALLNASSDIFAQFNVVRVFEQNIRDTLNLDMFSIRTQVLQNALLQASGILDTPVDRTASLGNYFDNTTLYLGKYFGPDFFIQSMVSLRYDPENKNSLSGGLVIEPEIGAELRSPLFTVNWNFVPKAGDRLFINSQSVTISWKWSF